MPVEMRDANSCSQQLDDVAARDAVAHRQRHDRRLQARPERARGDLRGQHRRSPRAAVRAAHALGTDARSRVTAITGNSSTWWRAGSPDRDPLGLAEHVPAAASRRPVLDDLVDRPRRQQRPALALMTGLRALLAPRPVLAAPRRRARRILTGRRRRVARRRDPAGAQAARSAPPAAATRSVSRCDLLVHPQQHRDDHLAALVIDRLRLSALHASRFDARRLCPPNRLNAYPFILICSAFARHSPRWLKFAICADSPAVGHWCPNGFAPQRRERSLA